MRVTCCPRCKSLNIKIFNVKRFSYNMPICKCTHCGFLFITDEDLLKMGNKESKKLFVEYIRSLGKNGERSTA
jgi:hypothetical protein